MQGTYTVRKVVDGDTIYVDANGTTSAQAKAVLAGQQVYLESDPSQDSVDKYQRTLAYVRVNGRLSNMDMITSGFAHEYTYDCRIAISRTSRRPNGLWSPNTFAA